MSAEQAPLATKTAGPPDPSRREFLKKAGISLLAVGGITTVGSMTGGLVTMISDQRTYLNNLGQEAPSVDPTKLQKAQEIRDGFVAQAATPAAEAAAQGSGDIYVHIDNPQDLSQAIGVLEQESLREKRAEDLTVAMHEDLRLKPWFDGIIGGTVVFLTGLGLDVIARRSALNQQ